MSWFILIRHATFQNVILAKMSSEIHIPAAILSLDLEKAFDRVEWRVCLLPLKRWALALPSLGGSVFILRRGVRFLLMATHLLFFYPTRGVRQGFPLSPLLYVLTMEVLTCNLRAHPDLVGIRLPNSTVSLPVVSLYAVDTSAIVISDSGIKAIFDT